MPDYEIEYFANYAEHSAAAVRSKWVRALWTHTLTAILMVVTYPDGILNKLWNSELECSAD